MIDPADVEFGDVTERLQSHVFRQAPGHLHAVFLFVDPRSRSRECLHSIGKLFEDELIQSDARIRETRPEISVAVGMTHQALQQLLEPETTGPGSTAYGSDTQRYLELGYRPLPVRSDNRRLRVDDDGPANVSSEESSPVGGNVLEDPYKEGMQARRELLNDPETEWDELKNGLLIWATSNDRGNLENFAGRLKHLDPHAESGSWPENFSVFGYRDGRSQPYVDELGSQQSAGAVRGGGTRTDDGWRPVPSGEFILGRADACGVKEAPGPQWLTRDGTFLVYRKYRLFPERFTDLLKHAVSQMSASGLNDPDVAAKLMGRYRLVDQPDEDLGDAVLRNCLGVDRLDGYGPRQGSGPNDFDYSDDSAGYVCPLGAHIRRSNPRDSMGSPRLVERHRIIRRGIPWEDECASGLHFVAVNARIADQFEFIQRQWLNTGHTFRLGADADLFAGSRPVGASNSRFVIQGPTPTVITPSEPLFELKGGDYFLMPGIAGLRKLVDRG